MWSISGKHLTGALVKVLTRMLVPFLGLKFTKMSFFRFHKEWHYLFLATGFPLPKHASSRMSVKDFVMLVGQCLYTYYSNFSCYSNFDTCSKEQKEAWTEQ